jgi:RNA polymerase sigma-70 factor (ECF subfamily)
LDNSTQIGNSDSTLIQQYLETGNNRFLAMLYERYKQRIFGRCMKMVRNVEEAKDLTSETFMRAFGHLSDFDITRPFYPWLSRIATNLCIDHLRKQSRQRFEQLGEHHARTQVEQEDNEDQERLAHKILNAIQKLKQPQRRCFCLFYIHHLSYKEISKITGLTYDQVRSHIQNGRRRFRILMEEK